MKVCVSDKGFTIVETMVALAVLSLGILGVGTMLATSLSADRLTAETKNAEAVGLQKIEDLKSQKTSVTDPLTSGSGADATYAYKWSVSNYQWLDTKQNSGSIQLDVTVGWPIDDKYNVGLCTSSTVEQCPHTFSVTTYFQPLKQ